MCNITLIVSLVLFCKPIPVAYVKMNTMSSFIWLLPYLVLPTFNVGIALLMHYIQSKMATDQSGDQSRVLSKQQQNWINANQTALNYLVYASVGFLVGLIAFLSAMGKSSVERWHGGSMNLYIIFICPIIMILSNVVRNYKLKQITARSEKSGN